MSESALSKAIIGFELGILFHPDIRGLPEKTKLDIVEMIKTLKEFIYGLDDGQVFGPVLDGVSLKQRVEVLEREITALRNELRTKHAVYR